MILPCGHPLADNGIAVTLMVHQSKSFLALAVVALFTAAALFSDVASSRERPKPKDSKPSMIVGTEDSDRLVGTSGSDKIRARGGNDTVDGRGGNDTISGDAGNDVIRGGAGADVLLGGGGKDRIDARDREQDTIACGKGRDIVYADQIDIITGECEVVRVSKP